MASKTSKMLSEEHENILKVVGALDKECDELTNGQEADENFILNVVDFIKISFIDSCILFKYDKVA